MRLHTLKPAQGSKKKRKIIGRGAGSGHGGTSGRGHKGQRARTGGTRGLVKYEGGQQPLYRRLPKRGFTNIHREEYTPVNVKKLDQLTEVSDFTPETYAQLGLAGKRDKVKILGTGEISRAVTVAAHSFSSTAVKKIEAAGGKVVRI